MQTNAFLSTPKLLLLAKDHQSVDSACKSVSNLQLTKFRVPSALPELLWPEIGTNPKEEFIPEPAWLLGNITVFTMRRLPTAVLKHQRQNNFRNKHTGTMKFNILTDLNNSFISAQLNHILCNSYYIYTVISALQE